MNDIELDDLLDKWIAPAAPESLRAGVRGGVASRVERRSFHGGWARSLMAAGALALLLTLVTKAVPQTLPQDHRPYSVLSEFVRYAEDGSAKVQMYSTSYNDQYGREIMLARHLPDSPFADVMARTLDAVSGATLPARMFLLRLSPGGSEMLDRQAAMTPGRSVNTECSDSGCFFVGHHVFPQAVASPGGCVDGAAVDGETILGYWTEAMQLPLDGNRIRRTLWMAPALGCFALKVATEQQMADGTFRLLSGKQAVAVRLNP